MWSKLGGKNQQFKFSPVMQGSYWTYFYIQPRNSDCVLSCEGNCDRIGTQIHLWESWGGPSQKFRLLPVDGSTTYFQIQPAHTARVLDCSDVGGRSSSPL